MTGQYYYWIVMIVTIITLHTQEKTQISLAWELRRIRVGTFAACQPVSGLAYRHTRLVSGGRR